MTRINSNLNPKLLSNEHLLAEHREIKRIPALYRDRINSSNNKPLPTKFCLGTGHVLFFINKPEFTLNRYKELYKECKNRGFEITDYSDNWNIYKDYPIISEPYIASQEDINLIKERIKARIVYSTKSYFHYYTDRLTNEETINLLYDQNREKKL